MNQQNMFSSQEHEPGRYYNTDPREQMHEQPPQQPGASETDGRAYYTAGYSGPSPENAAFDTGWISNGSEKLRPQFPQPSSPWQWLIVAIVVLALASVTWSMINFIFSSFFMIVGIAIAIIAVSQFSARAIVVPTRIFTLAGTATLMIQDQIGTVRIHSGNDNSTIEVRATKYVNGWFAAEQEGSIVCEQADNTLRVATQRGFKWSPLGGLRNVNFDITVPPQCNIQINSEAGTIDIAGVRGVIQAKTSAGTVDIQQSTLEGPSNITTNAGTINVRQATLKGQVNFQTNAGTVYFSGRLDPRGSYRLGTNMGTIDVVLPADQSFTLAASSDLGTVTNQFGNTIVGQAPHARLELKTNMGTVNVQRA